LLKTRVIAALIFAPAVLALVVLGGLALKIACLFLAWLMFWEFASLTLGPSNAWLKVVGYGLVSVVAARTVDLGPAVPFELLLPLGTLVVLAVVLSQPEPIEGSMKRAAFVFLGTAYCGGLIPYLSRLRELEHGAALAIMALFCTWGADTGAYLVGRAFGRHKLYPKVSPGKTWEGLAGGLVFGVGVAFLVRYLFRMELGIVHVAVIGVIGAAFGLVGDLAESLMKRSVGAKDSGTLIPGHGGVLDRFDAVMFVTPAVYAYVALLKVTGIG
jgi:phosphatidate cytidylyltransferase